MSDADLFATGRSVLRDPRVERRAGQGDRGVARPQQVRYLVGLVERCPSGLWRGRPVGAPLERQRIVKWDAASGAPLQTTLVLPNDQLVVFGPGGEVRHATPKADDELIYIVEKPSGEQEMLTPAEFRQRVEAAAK